MPLATVSATTTTTTNKATTQKRKTRCADPIVAPGFGTQRDLERLSRELSTIGQTSPTLLSVETVQRIMSANGAGMRRSRNSAANNDDDAEAAAAPASTAWADFMQEEGVADTVKKPAAAAKRNRGSETSATAATTTSSAAAPTGGGGRVYKLASQKTTKKPKSTKASGVLVQTGLLDSSIVGRTKKFDLADHLNVPTKLLPDKIEIASVHTAGHACHSVAVTTDGTAYVWGRNEGQQLTDKMPENVLVPTILKELPGKVQSAAVGKSHTLFLLQDGTVFATGNNKAGQCGVKSNTDTVSALKQCVFPDDMDSTIIQVACGEDFSVAVCDDGYLYTTGSSEFGQLGNGETGEHIVTAGKVAFSNCNAWQKRTTFCHAPTEKLFGGGDASVRVVPLPHIKIQQVACGKHHALALEADCEDPTEHARLFSWGCGDYGVLGHGVQKDEYFPRLVGTLANVRFPSVGESTLRISAGQHCSLLQTVNGHVYYFGKHRSVGEATMRPTLIDALSNNQHIVTHAAAGGQTVVCCTKNGVTVAYGQGPHGELGLGSQKKSSAKPTFVPGLDSCRIASLACGYGHTLFTVMNEDAEDKAAVKKLPQLPSAKST